MKDGILVVHPGSLGDVLLSLRALRSIKRTFPEHRVILVCCDDVGSLLRDCGEVDEHISIGGRLLLDLFQRERKGWSPRTSLTLDSCVRVVCWLKDEHGDIFKNLEHLYLESIIVRSPLDECYSNLHVEYRYLETLSSWNLKLEKSRTLLQSFKEASIRSSAKEIRSSDETHDEVIGLHPGSGSSHKCADPNLLSSVAVRLLKVERRRLWIFNGPADERFTTALSLLLPPNSYKIIEEQSLASMVSYLSKLSLFIGHDSGLTHLSAVCSVPSVVLFGPTDPGWWAPKGTNISVIQGNSCECRHDWSLISSCLKKPCLSISPDYIVQESERLLAQSVSEDMSTLVDTQPTSR